MILYIIVIVQSFFSCNSVCNIRNEVIQEELNTTDFDSTAKSEVVSIDTTSLAIFWRTFKKNITTNNKIQIIENLDYPIHAYYFVLFQYSTDCDTLKFIDNEKKYYDLDITKENIKENYELIFTADFISIIKKITISDILNKGVTNKNDTGLTFRIFAREFKKTNCYNDHELKLYFKVIDNYWKIGIGGL